MSEEERVRSPLAIHRRFSELYSQGAGEVRIVIEQGDRAPNDRLAQRRHPGGTRVLGAPAL